MKIPPQPLHKRIVLACILLLALFPRLFLLLKATEMGLGVDELQSAIHSFLPFDQLLISVRAFDPHPPLYYIQLHYWEKLGTSDLWLRLNTLLWSMLSVLSLYFAAGKIFDYWVGAFAAFFLALSAVAVSFSVELRMYALMILASIWVWYFTHQFFHAQKEQKAAAGLFFSTLIFLYSQGSGFLILPSAILYAILCCSISWKKKNGLFVKYLIVQGVICVFYIPWLLRAQSINVAHPLAPGAVDLAYTLAQLLFGTFSVISSQPQVIYCLAVIVFCLCISILLSHKSSRTITISFIVVPLFTCFLISHVIKPIWLTRTVVQVSPFINLGLALVAVNCLQPQQLRRNNRLISLIETGVIGIVLLASVAGIIYQQAIYSPWSPMKEAAEFVRKHVKPQDYVYVPNQQMYWGWGWYFWGPGSVSPVATNYIEVQDGVTVVSRYSVSNYLETERNWWVVHRDTDDLGVFASGVDLPRSTPAAKFSNVMVDQVFGAPVSTPETQSADDG